MRNEKTVSQPNTDNQSIKSNNKPMCIADGACYSLTLWNETLSASENFDP